MSKKSPIKDLPATNAEQVKGGMDGITRLIAVTQEKANNANDSALAGGDKQRKLIK